VANALVTIAILLTDNIRGCLERVRKTDDIKEIRVLLEEIERNVDQLVASAEAAEPDRESD